MLVIALTGGIGSGKSVVSEAFARLGVPVIDTDRIAHELVQPGQPALAAIRREFGAAIVLDDGHLDRAQLRRRIFDSQTDRARLEAILHPRIEAEVKRRIAELAAPYCIVVIPLLVETNGYDFIDRVLVVDTTEEKQIERTMQRDRLDRQAVQKILQSQASREQRLKRADDVIFNDDGTERVRSQVESLHHYYVDLTANAE